MEASTVDFTKGFILGEWQVEPLAGCFRKADHTVHVEPKVMDVLLCLARAGGEIVSRQQLLQEVWPAVVVSEEVLTRAISELRSLLGDTAREKRFIRTVPKRGYALLMGAVPLPPPVHNPEAVEAQRKQNVEASVAVSDGSARQDTPGLPWYGQLMHQFLRLLQSIVQSFGKVMIYSVLGICGLLLVLGLVALLNSDDTSGVVVTSDSPEGREILTRVLDHIDHKLGNADRGLTLAKVQTIAVLPFVNLSAKPDQDYFVDGVSEDIRQALIEVPGIKVVARTSSRVFKGRAQDVREIGKVLGADALVEGTVRVDRERVRVTVQLTDVREGADSGFPFWASSYDRDLKDAFTIQQQIAREVASELELQLKPPAAAKPVKAAAYEKYLLGRHYWHQRTATSLQQAIQQFQAAIALEPEYAQAYSGLADAYSFSTLYADQPKAETLALARQHMERALRLDPQLAEAHASKGVILELEMRTRESRRAYERAIQLKPGYSMAHMWLGNVLMTLDELQLAYAEYSEALDRDPLHPQIQINYLSVMQAMGRYQEVVDLGAQFYAQSQSEHLLKQRMHALNGAGRYSAVLDFALRHNFSDEYAKYASALLIEALIRLDRLTEASRLMTQNHQQFDHWELARLEMLLALKKHDRSAIFAVAGRIEEMPASDVWTSRASCTDKLSSNAARAEYWRGLGHYIAQEYSRAASYFASAQEKGGGCWMDPDIELSLLLYRVDVAQLTDAGNAAALLQELSVKLRDMQEKGWRHLPLQITQLSYYVLSGQKHKLPAELQRMQREGLQPWGTLGLDPFFQRHLQLDSELTNLFQPLQQEFVLQQRNSQHYQFAKFGL